jgi:ATP-dependent Lhr-like helicase
LGTLPLSQPVEKGSDLIFAGKRWLVQELDMDKKLIQVTAARGGKVPMFSGNSGLVDNGVREEMRKILAETDPIQFLDTTATELLKEARATFYRMKLDKELILINKNNTLIFPWLGDRVISTIELMLKHQGLETQNQGLYLKVAATPTILLAALRNLALSPPVDSTALVGHVINKWLEKWDNLLPDELLAKNYSSHTLDIVGGHEAIKTLALQLNDY